MKEEHIINQINEQAFIEKFKNNIPYFYKGSYINPIRHASYTLAIGSVAKCIENLEPQSDQLKLIQADLVTVYKQMSKLQRMQKINLTGVTELDSYIVSLLLDKGQGTFDNDQIARVRQLYSAKTMQQIYANCATSYFKFLHLLPPLSCGHSFLEANWFYEVALELEKDQSKQPEENIQSFFKALSYALSANQSIEIPLVGVPGRGMSPKELKNLGNHLTYFSQKMSWGYSITREIFENSSKLKILHMQTPSLLPSLKCPELVEDLRISHDGFGQFDNSVARELKDLVNIERFSNGGCACNWTELPNLAKLKTLWLINDKGHLHDPGLARCTSLESLKIIRAPEYDIDLSLIIYPEKLKYLNITQLKPLSSEILMKFMNVETLYLKLDDYSAKSLMNVVKERLSKLSTLFLKIKGDFTKMTKGWDSYQSVKKLVLVGVHKTDAIQNLVDQKFPNAKVVFMN